MVQLKEEMATPKGNKKGMAKNGTPAKSPKGVAMKAKDKVSPQKTPKIKKLAQSVVGTPKQEEKLKSILQTPKSNKKQKASQAVKEETMETAAAETPKSNKKKNKKTPQKVKEAVESEEEEEETMETAAETPKSNKKKNKKTPQKVKEAVESEEEETMETVPETPKSNKKKDKKTPKKEQIESQKKQSKETPRTKEDQYTDEKKYDFVAHVKGLDYKMKKADLMKHFSKYGTINVHLAKNKRDKKLANGGYGFIFFKEEKDMKAAIKGKNELNGQELTVSLAKPTTEKRKREDDGENNRPSKKMALCPSTSLFVGRLDPKTTEETLKKYFSKYGEIKDLTVFGKPGNSKGYGFLNFAGNGAMEKALADTHKVDGRDIICQKRNSPTDVSKIENKKESKIQKENEIMVRDLPKTLTRDEFKESFAKFGEIEWVTLPLINRGDPTAGVKGFGFIAFKTAESFKKALAAKTMTVLGKAVKVSNSKSENDEKSQKKQPKVETTKEEESDDEEQDDEEQDDEEQDDEEESDDGEQEDEDDVEDQEENEDESDDEEQDESDDDEDEDDESDE